MSAQPDLERRIDDALDAKRGVTVSFDDLRLLSETGALDALRQAMEDERRANDIPRIIEGHGDDPFVYFIQSESGPIKIGRTRNVKQRLHALQISTHSKLQLLAAVRAPHWAELHLQQHFAPERIRGEWYRPSPRLLACIAEAGAR